MDWYLHGSPLMHDSDTAAILVHASALFRLALGLSDDHPIDLGPGTPTSYVLGDARSAVRLLQPVTRASKVEILQALYLDRAGRLIDQRILNSGTENKTLMSPRQILQPAMKVDAHALILAHNHPCGDPNPSTEDVRATFHLIPIARSIGVCLRDHIILTDTKYFSMREAGLIESQSFTL